MTSKKDFIDYLNKFPITKLSDSSRQSVFEGTYTPCCYLSDEGNDFITLADHIKFVSTTNPPSIQYYYSVDYSYDSPKDFKLFKEHLDNLYKQLQIAIKDQKDYYINKKLRKIEHDFK